MGLGRTNYDPGRKHPLLVFLNGGDGGTGSNPGVARSISAEKDFVCISVPLFKKTDPKSPGGDYVMRDPDARYMWPFFRVMLAKLEELVPNIDPAHRVLGGFSNGAHAVQGLIDGSDGEIARRFSAFFFVEGGGRLQHYELLKGKPYLMVSSSAKSQPRAQQVFDAAKVERPDCPPARNCGTSSPDTPKAHPKDREYKKWRTISSCEALYKRAPRS